MGKKPKQHDHPKEWPESALLQKGLPCDECGSSDALALYSDDHTHCFSCGKTKGGAGADLQPRNPADGDEPDPSPAFQDELASSRHVQIKTRGLTQATCMEWDYRVRQRSDGSFEQLAIYRDRVSRAIVGIKVRKPDKEFYWIGSAKDQLWGAHKYPAGGKRLTIIEGEIDTLTVSQAYAHKWPVVSVPNGAHEAEKCIRKNLEYVSSFEEVVFGFDMDRQGQDAAVACARLLPPGKARIVNWEDHDANDMHVNGKSDRITWCVHTAERYRPDGIVDARKLTASVLTPPSWGTPWPWDFMTKWTYGRRPGELYVFGSGTGMGKTDVLAEIVASTLQGRTKDGEEYQPAGFGVFGYEASAEITKLAIAGKIAGKRFHIPQDGDFPEWSEEDLRAAMDRMDGPLWKAGGKLFINDAMGAADWESFKERARYLHHAEGITHFIGDPISAWAAGEEDERKFLDNLILEAAQLSVELKSCLYFASHLTRPMMGPSHEEGGRVQLRQFRGSNGIGMFANFAFGLERNQQADDAADRAVATMRVVKDRFTGNSIGKTHQMVYDQTSGSYDAVDPSKFLGNDHD